MKYIEFKNFKPFIIFSIIFLFNFLLLTPGAFTNDSLHQYQHALSGQYITHHPPVMAFWWSLMMKIFNTPATMLFFHLTLLIYACYNFYLAFETLDSKWRYAFILLPFYPIIFLYSLMIWKDVGFAYSYLFVISWLVRVNNRPNDITKTNITLILAILFYGTAVKYQARFVLPLMCFWFVLTVWKENSFKRILVYSITMTLLVFLAVTIVDKILVSKNTQGGNTESWQYVKLYDLAGISVQNKKILFPEYVLQGPKFNENKLHEHYNNFLVDPLVSNVLPCVTNKEQLNELWWFWFKTIVKYPKSYFKHRQLLFKNTIKKEYWIPYSHDLANIKSYELKEGLSYTIYRTYLVLFSEISPFKKSIIFIPFYIVAGVIFSKYFRDSRPFVLTLMNIMALVFCSIIFFFSMASDPRYLLFPYIMVIFSHVIFASLLIPFIKIKFQEILDKLIELIYARLIAKNLISKN